MHAHQLLSEVSVGLFKSHCHKPKAYLVQVGKSILIGLQTLVHCFLKLLCLIECVIFMLSDTIKHFLRSSYIT